MAARAVWQRSANRYFVQEDAKRAPKLACCPSTSSLLSKSDTKPATTTDVNDDFAPLNDKSSYSNLSSDSKWWLQMRPDYMYQRGLTSEQVNTLETQNSHQFVENQDGSSIHSVSNKSYEFVEMHSVDLPWWQMGEKDDFTSFVTKKSNSFIEKYGLPKPIYTGSFSKPQMIKCNQSAISQVEVENVTNKPIREIDSSKSKILEALCHSQTRARKAENAAKEAYAEKEHVIKLLFKQASQLFAYRQWIYLLQLENLCYQMKNKNSNTIPSKNGKLHKNLKVPLAKGKRTRTRRGVGRHEHNIGKYAVVFMVGLGIVGAGLLLGWTVGWMLL